MKIYNLNENIVFSDEKPIKRHFLIRGKFKDLTFRIPVLYSYDYNLDSLKVEV